MNNSFRQTLIACLVVVGSTLSASSLAAEEVPEQDSDAPEQGSAVSERDPYATVGVGIGMYWYLPSLRLFARYALHDISFEVRAGVFAPTFAVEGFFWDAAAGPRFHVLQRESIVGFITPRVGFWDIGPASEDEDDNGIGVNESDSRARKLLNPMVSLDVGADFFLGSFVVTPEVGVGTVWGQRFTNMDAPVIFAELNANAGWVF